MTTKHFFSLSLNLQQEYLYLHGEMIAEIEENDFYTALFLVNDFYLEAFLCKRSSEVLCISIQADPEVQLMYLQKLDIDISNLVN